MAWELNLKANTYDNQLVTNKIISSVTVGVQDGAKADATPEEERKKNKRLICQIQARHPTKCIEMRVIFLCLIKGKKTHVKKA